MTLGIFQINEKSLGKFHIWFLFFTTYVNFIPNFWIVLIQSQTF